jgi:hypothetical protein
MRQLFADPLPELNDMRQGPLGDCYLISVIGAAVNRDSGSVHDMIVENDDHSYTVHFANGRDVDVPPLTDAEVATSSTTGRDGLWLPVIENAYALTREQALPAEWQTETATDAIARGGHTAKVIPLLTGHQAEQIPLQLRSNVPGGRQAYAAQVRQALTAAVNDHRLITVDSPERGYMPPGLEVDHSYAILSYDNRTDMLRLWDPHNLNFYPNGSPGPANGYATEAGQFDMPLTDALLFFRVITLESTLHAPKYHALDAM